MTKDNKKEIDKHSGVETTGHEWDGIKELNNPAPRWWLWVFILTCVWSFGYWVVYPAWPTISGEGERGGTVGSQQWTQYKQLEEQQADILARKEVYLQDFKKASFEQVLNDPTLYAFAIAGGKSVFKENCATCHGTGGAGIKNYPNLNDDDWLWGGTIESIYQTIKYGIRADHEDSRFSEMPSFAETLTTQQTKDVAKFVLNLASGKNYPQTGASLYQEHCASCHGSDGRGDQTSGAPNLVDSIWFYSQGEEKSIVDQIRQPKHGMMPAWVDRLDEDTIRQLTLYVYSLGGGE